MLTMLFLLTLCGSMVSAGTTSIPADAPPGTPPLPAAAWLPNQRQEYRHAMRFAFLDACAQICPEKDKACIERCALRPLADIAAESDEDEELRVCRAAGGAWIDRIPACASALAHLMVVSSAPDQGHVEANEGLESRRDRGLRQLTAMLEAATAVGRFCSPEALCKNATAETDVSEDVSEEAH